MRLTLAGFRNLLSGDGQDNGIVHEGLKSGIQNTAGRSTGTRLLERIGTKVMDSADL